MRLDSDRFGLKEIDCILRSEAELYQLMMNNCDQKYVIIPNTN